MAKKRATIQDVSRLCGLSTATVSRVLNHTGRFSKSTERIVHEAINKLGFVPNLTAKNLRTQTSHLVGILVSKLSYEYVNQIVTTLEEGLFEQGYIAIVCNISENYENEQTYLDAMFALNICALVVFSSGRHITQPADRCIPVIYINRYPENLNDQMSCAIETDSVAAGYKAGLALLEAGCKRPAMVRRQVAEGRRPRGREIGFMKAMCEKSCAYDESLFVSLIDHAGYTEAFNSVNAKLDSGLTADGYFCESDIFALGTIRSLEMHGLLVPNDVKVIGCNDMSVALYNNHAITTIRHQTSAICTLAIENMKRMISGKQPIEKHVIFDVELVRRETV